MSAARTILEPGACLVIGVTTLPSFIKRSICVAFTPGYPPSIDLVRMNLEGKELGHLRCFDDLFPSLRSALDATRSGVPFTSDTRGRSTVIRVSANRGSILISTLALDLVPRGGVSVLRGEELDLLAEALVIASYRS